MKRPALSRVPIRIRLTLPFALAMAVVLAALGAFVYLRVGSTLLHTTDQNLLAQATEATLRLDKGRPPLDRDNASGVSFAQVLSREGTVVTSEPVGLAALIDPARAARVAAGSPMRASVSLADRSGRWRLLAIPIQSGGDRSALVLASSLDARDESLERLRKELLVASPLALLLATLAGYALAGAALRPVEAMRREAAKISAATPGSRLPVPEAKDEVQRLAETLNDMLARLETAFEHERRFVADASHELRTPLALLKTELELALRHPRSRVELEDALRSAAEETERLSALASDLLLIARSDQRGLPIDPAPVSSGELFADVAERFSSRAEELGRSLVVEEGDDFAFEADPKRIEQALGNLVDNALVHGSGAVTLRARRKGESIELHVTDEGAGFPAGFEARAFDRFSRADEARSRSGSGLGLAIVQTIADAHGGTACVSPGEGADIWLSLPIGSPPSRVRPVRGAALRRSG
ncbi:MAG TPA: ATP-binding protein [Gaiellaceae bacterium]|nr:ATP-binding protein [Gaiellaceae bacterium]